MASDDTPSASASLRSQGAGKKSQSAKNKRRWRVSSSKGPHLDHVRNDINVTPLVDVMLVLLIIFMLMTLIMGRGQDVSLPRAQNFSEEKDKMQPVVAVDAAGTLFIEKNRLGPVSPSTLKEMQLQVEAAWAAKPDAGRRVYLKADNSISYETVYPVLVYLNKEMALESVDLAITKKDAK